MDYFDGDDKNDGFDAGSDKSFYMSGVRRGYDEAQSMILFKLSVSELKDLAFSGSKDATLVLAVRTLFGYDAGRDVFEGLKLLGIAASMGSEEAMALLARLDQDNRVTFVFVDDESVVRAGCESEEFSERENAALAWAEVQAALSYCEGGASKRSEKSVMRWLEMADKRGCDYGQIYTAREIARKGMVALICSLKFEEDAADDEDLRKMFRKAREEIAYAHENFESHVQKVFATVPYGDEYERENADALEASMDCIHKIEAVNLLLKRWGKGDYGDN